MRKLLATGVAAAVLSAVMFAYGSGGAEQVLADHGIFNSHVHDDYFHPTGSFVPGLGHTTAQALCMGSTPDPTCTATVHAGDSVQWVAPAPLAVNPHTVTECTSATWTTCGAGTAAGNPIEDSGVRFQPGWPYLVSFSTPGSYYYRCEIHPLTMRGVVQVINPVPVGGEVDILNSTDDGGANLPLMAIAAAAGVVAIACLSLAARRRFAREELPLE